MPYVGGVLLKTQQDSESFMDIIYKVHYPDGDCYYKPFPRILRPGQSIFKCFYSFSIEKCTGCSRSKDMIEYIVAEMTEKEVWLELP